MDKILYLPRKLKDLSASLMASHYCLEGRYCGGNEQALSVSEAVKDYSGRSA
jgi:hypothetical protein